jgi:DNA-binding transcriptional regulator YdaS (Cro superfamily)
MRKLESVEEVIASLGGGTATATLLGQSPQTVSNWKKRGVIPPDYFVAINTALEQTGRIAVPSVFAMKAVA